MVVLDDLRYVWARRGDKPWVGIDHQWVPSDPRTHRSPFLNSGFQLVSDPAFYDLQENTYLAVFEPEGVPASPAAIRPCPARHS